MVKLAETPRATANAPWLSGFRSVCVSGSQALSSPVRQTWRNANPSSVNPEPVTVTVAWSARPDAGSRVIVGPGTRGPSGRKASGARPARGDPTDPVVATSTHGSGVVRQSVVPDSPNRSAATCTSWVNVPPGPMPSTKPMDSQAPGARSAGHTWSSRKRPPKPEPVTVTIWPSTKSWSGATVRVGATTSVSGSKASGAVPSLRASRPESGVTTTMQAPGSRQSTAPEPPSMRAETESWVDAEPSRPTVKEE